MKLWEKPQVLSKENRYFEQAKDEGRKIGKIYSIIPENQSEKFVLEVKAPPLTPKELDVLKSLLQPHMLQI